MKDSKIKGQIKNHWKIFHKELMVYNLLFLPQIYEKFGTKFLYETQNQKTFNQENTLHDTMVRYVCGMSVPPLMTTKIAEFESNNELNAS